MLVGWEAEPGLAVEQWFPHNEHPPYSTSLYLLQMEGSPISMRLRLNLPLLHEIGGFKWHKWHLMNHLLWYSDSQPHSSHFPAIPLVFKLAWNYANDPNKGLSLPSLSLLCCICQRQHRANEIKFTLAMEVYDHYLRGVSVLMIYFTTKTSEN